MRLFLDTTVLLSALTNRKPAARKLLDSSHALFTSEYAIKEVRRALTEYFGLSQQAVNLSVEEIRTRVKILPTPSKQEFRKIVLSDKSDAPIVCSAMQASCVLVTDDVKTLREAKRYVKPLRSEEAAGT